MGHGYWACWRRSGCKDRLVRGGVKRTQVWWRNEAGYIVVGVKGGHWRLHLAKVLEGRRPVIRVPRPHASLRLSSFYVMIYSRYSSLEDSGRASKGPRRSLVHQNPRINPSFPQHALTNTTIHNSPQHSGRRNIERRVSLSSMIKATPAATRTQDP